jgi:hypothetical protein
MTLDCSLAPGAKQIVYYINAIGGNAHDALATYQRIAAAPERTIADARENWNRELAAVFTPGNDRYSGSLPELDTADRDITRIYHTGILGVISFKRDTPFSVIGRAYDTLMPKWWQTVTFIWDYSLSSLVHALLDPDVLRKYLHHWMKSDIHTHFGTEYMTGSAVGPWYSVNDFAMVDSRGVSPDRQEEWLRENVAGRPVPDYLTGYATNWKRFRQPSGLADYGGLLNLLECVSTYVHQVASLNAGNVFSLRTVAELQDLAGNGAQGQALRAEAQVLLGNILPLYNAGKGSWSARFPDGSLVDVRHCYDFFTVMNTIGDDLTSQQRNEMVAFFQREFQADTWMHALSCDDVMRCSASVRIISGTVRIQHGPASAPRPLPRRTRGSCVPLDEGTRPFGQPGSVRAGPFCGSDRPRRCGRRTQGAHRLPLYHRLDRLQWRELGQRNHRGALRRPGSSAWSITGDSRVQHV